MNTILELRQKKGLSQKEFAKELGISGAYLSLIEKGERQISNNFIKKLKAKIPNLDTNIFFTK